MPTIVSDREKYILSPDIYTVPRYRMAAGVTDTLSSIEDIVYVADGLGFGRRIKKMQRDSAIRLTRMDQWFRYWLPYSFEKLETDKRSHVYLPVNRNYKPLGVTSDECLDYEDFIEQAVIFFADPHTFDNVWFHRDTLHLYEDATSSRVDYFERLERLMSRSVKLFGASN